MPVNSLKPSKITPLEVKVEYNNLEKAIREFKILFQKERILGRLKEKEYYEKPSERKRRKRREALERRLMTESREKMMQNGEWDRKMKKRQAKRQRKLDNKQSKQLPDYLL
jgi:small subunit ribosomal protein S21